MNVSALIRPPQTRPLPPCRGRAHTVPVQYADPCARTSQYSYFDYLSTSKRFYGTMTVLYISMQPPSRPAAAAEPGAQRPRLRACLQCSLRPCAGAQCTVQYNAVDSGRVTLQYDVPCPPPERERGGACEILQRKYKQNGRNLCGAAAGLGCLPVHEARTRNGSRGIWNRLLEASCRSISVPRYRYSRSCLRRNRYGMHSSTVYGNAPRLGHP